MACDQPRLDPGEHMRMLLSLTIPLLMLLSIVRPHLAMLVEARRRGVAPNGPCGGISRTGGSPHSLNSQQDRQGQS